MTDTKPFTDTDRQPVVQALLEARKELDAAIWELDKPGGPNSEETPAAEARHDQARQRLAELAAVYRARLPRPAISRNPFTGKALRYPIDTLGLDGPWWDCNDPVRPEALLPEGVFALAGAVALEGKIPDTPFNVKPGPSVPWVCPRLLRIAGVRAVISQIQVGACTAWAVVYFSAHPLPGQPGLDTWGLNSHLSLNKDGSYSIASSWGLSSDYDYDLAPWIRHGKLLWIAAGDEGLQLHATVSDCPYLELPGSRDPVLLRNGRMESCLMEDADATEGDQ